MTYEELIVSDVEQKRRIEELKKELDSVKNTHWYTSRRADDLDTEVEQLHSLLDVLPGCIPRKAEDGYTYHKLIVRFATWMTNR